MRGALLAPLVGGLAGCGELARTAGLGDYVRVAVSWSAAELAAFQRVLDRSGNDNYELIPFGDDIGAALGASTTGRPDVVALPQPGHVAGNLDTLEPLPPDVWQPYYDQIWSQELPSARGEHFALPFKIAHASVVWYRRQVFADLGLEPPVTWPDWLHVNEAIVAAGQAPLALGGADGWLLARFFENVLLRSFVDTYDELLARPDARAWSGTSVRKAFEMIATMWGRPGALAGGPDHALVQQFPDAVLEVFRYDRAAMVVAPDFAESVIRRFAGENPDLGTFTFPGTGPLVISGDLLVLTSPASEAAVNLIEYLARPDAPEPWITGTGGFIAANPDTDMGYYSPTLRGLATELRQRQLRFGLSDQLGRLGGSEGLQRVLQNLLRALAAGTSPRDAADAACAQMVEAVHRTR